MKSLTQNNESNKSNVIQFPRVGGRIPAPQAVAVRHKAASLMNDIKAVEMNRDTDYAHMFGIDKGDIIFLDDPSRVMHGDLVLCSVGGMHDLDTFNEWQDRNGIVGVLLGCLKYFEKVPMNRTAVG